MGTRFAGHATPLYPQKLAVTSPTSGGRLVGVVRLRTKGNGGLFLCWRTIGLQGVKSLKMAVFRREMLW
jgi:hypothetical protein